MARVYLETSFVSACVTQRTDVGSTYRREASLRWWREQAPQSELFVSDEVLIELSDERYPRRDAALGFVEGIPVITVSPPMVALARVFVQRMVMPKPVGGDALHLAMAAVSEMEYLVTWNVQHLANPNKLTHLNGVCLEFGLVPPRIIRKLHQCFFIGVEGSWQNAIVDEVRRVREAIDEEVGHDLEKLADRARKAGEEYRRTHRSKVADLQPRQTSRPGS